MNFDPMNRKVGIAVLTGSQAMMEKDGYVNSGNVVYAEGDLIEITSLQITQYKLGDYIKVTVYSPKGIDTFYTSVVARTTNSIILIYPPANQLKYGELREFPRIQIEVSAVIKSLYSSRTPIDPPIQIIIGDISLGGIGFSTSADSILTERSTASVEIQLSDNFPCTIEIVRRRVMGNLATFGAKFLRVPTDKMNMLRGFILRTRIEGLLIEKEEAAKNFKVI
ncbi:PilZ domain-containing protein [Caldalkalibacillus mannanilyticus]|uniref:PilZ domain-containing protein n=1 Tax=Caldalkalibacillus mannanilyticus TaxID=1418 RepID=UPI0004698526|nr:PilZ domain-containing protein [Caldalkalibacillus mannanilyticus]